MNTHIIINKNVYIKFKDDIITLNPRLFCDEHFYNLNDYKIPLDLSGIQNYLTYTDVIELHTLSTFIDFVNILLVLSFLKENNYNGKVIINYYFLHEFDFKKARFVNITLTNKDYNDVDNLLNCLKEEKQISKYDLKLPGILNFINFYNMLVDGEKFIMSLSEIIEEYDEDIDLIASYLNEKHSNIGLNKDYYLKYLNKYL